MLIQEYHSGEKAGGKNNHILMLALILASPSCEYVIINIKHITEVRFSKKENSSKQTPLLRFFKLKQKNFPTPPDMDNMKHL